MCSPRAGPKDGRYGENPNRLQHYYQFQVILKPNPPDLQELYLASLDAIGVDLKLHDIRFVEDDWESPTLGAWGLGWECWCDGMEVIAVHLFPAGRRLRMRAGRGRTDLRSRAPRHVRPGRRERLRPELQRRRGRRAGHLRRRLPAGRAGIFAPQFRGRRHRDAVPAVHRCGEGLPDLPRRRRAGGRDRPPPDGAAGLRPVHQGEPRLQPARRPRRHLGDRAPELYPAGARTGKACGAAWLRTAGGGARPESCRLVRPRSRQPRTPSRHSRPDPMPDLLLELLSEEIPARMQRRRPTT